MRDRRTPRGERRKSFYVWSFGLAALFSLVAIASVNQTALDRLTALVFDVYQQIKPRQEAGAPVVVVDIDEASLRTLGQWPWPRPVIARIIDRLGELGAATIAFDMVLAEPDRTSISEVVRDLQALGAEIMLPDDAALPDNDAILAAAFARNNVTAGFVVSNDTSSALPPPKAGFSFAGSDPRAFLVSYSGGVANLPVLTEAAAGAGFFSFPPTRDGVVRSVPLVAQAQEQLYASLAAEALRVAQGAGSYIVRSTGASGEADTGIPAMTALKVGALEVPTGPAGEIWIYYSGLPSMRTLSAALFADSASSATLGEAIAGHIVLIGSSAAGLRDIVATPLTASLPGVRVHAEIIDQILGETFLTRPDWAKGAEVVTALFLGVLLLFLERRAGALVSAFGLVALVAIALAVSWFAFAGYRLLIDPILPAAAVAAVFGVTMPLLLLLTDREKQFVRRAFAQYLAPSLVERLADNPSALTLGGELRQITVLFSDIRSFTTLSEGLDPQDLTTLLNNFLTPMTDVLLRSEATIDKYIGDAIMAFWNAPLDVEGHERRACLAALDMLKALGELNRTTGSSIKIGIGLNSGTCCVGNLGSAQRFSYSAIGDSVNVASRVEGLTKTYRLPILLTESVRAAAGDLAFLEVDRVRVIGRAEPVPLFTVLGDEMVARQADFEKLAAVHAQLLAHYRAAALGEAEATLAEARDRALPGIDRLYEVYAERLQQLRREPPPPGWDGVFEATEK
jgi:adenylate cyclase